MISVRYLIILFLLSVQSFADKPLFKNKFYAFYFNQPDNTFRITDLHGSDIVSSASFYQLLIPADTNDTLSLKSSAQSPSIKKNGDMVEIIWEDSNSFYSRMVTLTLASGSEEIKFSIETRYKRAVQVVRDALIVNIVQQLKEVFRKNSLCDTSDFQREYWLNKEGARFGKAEKTLLVYHTPGVSSLQLNAAMNQLIINMDFCMDHPFQYFPLRDSMMNEKADLSCSIFKAGESRKNYFSLHAGKPIDFIPRLMLNPNGFLAAHIFTEHADWSDLPTHRAVYFGSEDILDAKNATGGFVKNKIPVTKSVFYANPDNVKNNESQHQSIFTTPIASIKGTTGFLDFLQQLKKEGDEICLHTPDQFSSSRKLTKEACEFMKKNFNSVTWIDHGYNNGPKNNREAFVCDGLNQSSPYFSKDIWEKNGLRYFWNSYYEDFRTPDSVFFDFNSSIMHPYPGFGDAAPAPLYWKHPTRTGNFYSWPTKDLLEMHDPEKWNFHFSAERLNDLVQQRSIKIQHCYPAGSIVGMGYWKMDDKKLIVDPNFEKTLEQLAKYRDKGLINLTTVNALLDYWITCESIRFDYLDSVTVKITNDNKTDVNGLSFAVAAKQVSMKNIFHQKFADGDLIFWFDMKAGESVVVNFSN